MPPIDIFWEIFFFFSFGVSFALHVQFINHFSVAHAAFWCKLLKRAPSPIYIGKSPRSDASHLPYFSSFCKVPPPLLSSTVQYCTTVPYEYQCNGERAQHNHTQALTEPQHRRSGESLPASSLRYGSQHDPSLGSFFSRRAKTSRSMMDWTNKPNQVSPEPRSFDSLSKTLRFDIESRNNACRTNV